MTYRRNIAFLAAALMVMFAMTAQAAIITPTDATATSSLDAARDIDWTIDGSGLSAGGTSGDILAETHNTNISNTYWLGSTGDVQVLDFDFGDATDVAAVHLWQYARSNVSWNTRALASFDIAFSTDNGATYSAPIPLTGLTIQDASLAGATPVQTHNFAAQTGVTDIQITNLVNHGDGSWYALAEMRFDTVPEPATLSLLVLGAIGLVRRRRK